MRSVLSIALLGCGLLTTTARAVPMVLYDNGPGIGTASSNSGVLYGNTGFVGDDFPLLTASTVTGVQFNGYGLAGAPVTVLDYYIYTAAGSLPGTLLTSGPAANLSTVPDGAYHGYQVTFDLDSPLALDSGRYYLVLGNPTPRPQAVDRTSIVAPGTYPSVLSMNSGDPPTQFSSNDFDLAFRILGTTGVTPAPEPSGFLLSGSMIGGALLLLRKRLRA